MWVVEIDLISFWGIELDFSFVLGSKSTSVLYAGPKIFDFNLWIDIDLGFVCGLKTARFSCGDRLTMFLCWWSKLT